LAETNLTSEKNLEVENFQLLTMIFSENFLSVEIFLEWKWAFRDERHMHLPLKQERPTSHGQDFRFDE
jgi:hypothetical protein